MLELKLVPAKNGLLTIQAIDQERTYFLHSVYDPEKEAEQWVNRQGELPADGIFFVCGGGLGYHLIALKRRYPQATIILTEPDPRLYEMGSENYKSLFNEGRFYFIKELTKSALEEVLQKTINFYSLDKFHFMEFKNISRHYPIVRDKIIEDLYRVVNSMAININTLVHFALAWPLNFFRNFKHILSSPLIDKLYGKFTDVPAILVSAGPSLNKNIDKLQDAKGKALIIAVGTAFKALLKQEIEPDLVISVDGGEPNYRHFEGIHSKVPLVFDAGIYWRIPEEYPGPKWACVSDPYLLNWFKDVIDIQERPLQLGPSVANIAFSLACQLACNPIIMVGQDLAYTDGKSHAAGTVYESKKPEEDGRHLIPVESIDGGVVYTDRVFLSFLNWYEKYIPQLAAGKKVIDATEGGARIPGTEIMTLTEAIRCYCQQEQAISSILHSNYAVKTLTIWEREKLTNKFKEIKNGLEKMLTVSLRGSNLARQLGKIYENKNYSGYKREISRLLKGMNEVDREIKELQQVTRMLILTFQPLLLRLYNSKFLEEKPGEGEQEAGIRIAKKSLLLYQGIAEIAQFMLPEMENILEWLSV